MEELPESHFCNTFFTSNQKFKDGNSKDLIRGLLGEMQTFTFTIKRQ